MLQVKTLTLTEFMTRLRKLGISIEYERLKSILRDGEIFKGVAWEIKGGVKDGFFILEKEFNKWVERYAEDVQPTSDILEYMKMQEEETA